jgi:hypothetical protein
MLLFVEKAIRMKQCNYDTLLQLQTAALLDLLIIKAWKERGITKKYRSIEERKKKRSFD